VFVGAVEGTAGPKGIRNSSSPPISFDYLEPK